MASPLGPAARRSRLESEINANARALGTSVRRYRDAFSRTMLLMALHRAIEVGLLDNYHLKGGAAIEVRHGFGARATRDVDIEIPVALDQLTTAFAAAITVGCGDFTFALGRNERVVRDDAVRVLVAMSYLGKPWATINVDLAPAQPGDLADHLPLMVVEFPEIAGEVRTMKTDFQMAQKIHAATTPDPPNYELPYARHVVDVLYLASTGVDPLAVGAACQAVFDVRSANDDRTWPPPVVTLPERWIADYAVTLDGYGMRLRPEDVPRAFQNLLATIIGGETPMPGYEYQFVSLAAKPTNNPGAALGGPIETGGLQHEHFVQLAANGWRVRSMCPHPREGSNILVVLEREIEPPT